MKQMQINDFFTKKRRNMINEINHKKRRFSDQQQIGEDNSDLLNSSSDSSSNSGAMATENSNKLYDIAPKSEEKEIDTLGQTNVHTSTEPESVIVCDVHPNIVNEIRSESSQSKEEKEKKTSVRKVNKSLTRNSASFILHTIDQYDKYLKTSDTFRGILTDESLALLSTLALESEDNKQLVSYLFCVDQYEPEGITDVDFPTETEKKQDINFDCTLLYERGFITFTNTDADVLTVDQCITLLTLSQTKEAFEKIINTTHWKPKTQEKMKREIIALYRTQDIREFLNDDKKSRECLGDSNDDKKSEVLKKLRSKVKKWKLSDLARETITELTVLMHLDSIFKMGCSIDLTNVYNDRPVMNFKPSGNTKPYPVDKDMILDNATIIFRNRKDFCAYLNALALSEEYKYAKDKREFVLRVYQLYKDVNKENMSHYRALPIWLRKFTPLNIYLDILEDSVTYLKKLKEYDRALEILDLLIAQVAFKQDSKANWYDTKAYIQLTYLKSPEKAARTLYEAFDAGLPEETVMTLRHRANQILAIKTISRSQIDQKVLHVLRVNAESEILERSIPDPHYHCQESAEKSNSRRRPRYILKNELVLAETLCCNIHKDEQSFTLVEHWEGNLMNAIYFMLFWDIIYTKLLAIGGIFLSHYQQHPLDMWCENFYMNRKARIDDFLTMIQNSTVDDIIKIITDRYDKLVQYDLPEMTRKMISCNNIEIVVRCLGPRALAAICRRLAQNYNYMRYGFPDLTLCNTENYTIEFREVKTNDNVRTNQIQWLHYLNEHNIKAGFCYLSNKKQQDIKKQEAANKCSIDSSYAPDTNNGDPQPGPSTNLVV